MLSDANKSERPDSGFASFQRGIRQLKDWDQRQRFSVVGQFLKTFKSTQSPQTRLRIIDVGSNVCSALETILPNEDFHFEYADVFPAGSGLGVESNRFHLLSPGSSLPFADHAFDVAMAIDVLEHVKPYHVSSLVNELCRVSKRGLILSYPLPSAEVRNAEVVANALYREKWGADHPFLIEHIEHGGVDEAVVLKALSERGWKFHLLENSPLEIWSAALIATEELHKSYGTTLEFKQLNGVIESATGHSSSSYRRVLVATPESLESISKHITQLSLKSGNKVQKFAQERIFAEVLVNTAREQARQFGEVDRLARRVRQLSLGVLGLEDEILVLDSDLVPIQDVAWDSDLEVWRQTGPRPCLELNMWSLSKRVALTWSDSMGVQALRARVVDNEGLMNCSNGSVIFRPNDRFHYLTGITNELLIELLPTPSEDGVFKLGQFQLRPLSAVGRLRFESTKLFFHVKSLSARRLISKVRSLLRS